MLASWLRGNKSRLNEGSTRSIRLSTRSTMAMGKRRREADFHVGSDPASAAQRRASVLRTTESDSRPARLRRIRRRTVEDKGYHNNQSLVDLEAIGVRTYMSEPQPGRRNWRKNPAARDAVYLNRHRIRGPRGLRLLRVRGEGLERPLAHLYETGGMRRVHLRGHPNIRKHLLIHAGGFNPGLLVRLFSIF
jgi:transposase